MGNSSQIPTVPLCAETEACAASNEPAFGFIVGNAGVPLLVRIYGNVIAAASMVFIPVNFIFLLFTIFPIGDKGAFLLEAGLLTVGFVMLWLGQGLYRGERQAVYGMCILAVLSVVFEAYWLFTSPSVSVVYMVGFQIVIFVPPVVAAFRRWELFH